MDGNPSPKYDSDEWKSWPPDIYLSVLLHQLRTPIYTIKGWLEILSDEDQKALHPKAMEGISNAVQHLEGVWDGVQDYYDVLQSKPRP